MLDNRPGSGGISPHYTRWKNRTRSSKFIGGHLQWNQRMCPQTGREERGSVCSIRSHPRYPGKAVLQLLEHELAAIAVLHIDAGDYAHSADVTIRLLINGNLVASIG